MLVISSSCLCVICNFGVHVCGLFRVLEPEFLNFTEPRNRFHGINSGSLCGLAGRYDNPIPTRFLASIDCLTIPALFEYICPKKQDARFGRKTVHVVH
jgi:hypothetical protein